MLGAEGLVVAAAVPVVVGGREAATAIMIPATTATTPPMTPAASSRMVQVEAGAGPDAGPSPVTKVPPRGLDWHVAHPFRRPPLATASPARIPTYAQQERAGVLSSGNDRVLTAWA